MSAHYIEVTVPRERECNMSELTTATGGDGWSQWWTKRLRSGAYEIEVASSAEKAADGTPKVLHHSENIRDGREAVNKAISVSAEYAHRMAS